MAERTAAQRERARRYYEANSEKVKERSRQWYAANRERVREREQEKYATDPEAVKARRRQYRDANLEAVKEQERRSRQAHPEGVRRRSNRWKAAHPDAVKESGRRYRTSLRTTVFDHYGWACACCGSTERPTMDHVNGDGREHREELFGSNRGGNSSNLYRWLITNGFPDGFQTLCWPCNVSKRTGERCRLNHQE